MAGNYQDGWIVALLAILVPIIMMVIIVVPIYASAVIGLYFVYGEVIFKHWDRYNMVLHTYQQLYKQWQTVPEYEVMNFLAPTFAPVIIGAIVTLLLILFFIRYVKGVFTI